jgi:hypothetical protein
MFGLLVVSVPIALLNELNAIAALLLIRGGDFLSLFEKPQRVMLFLNLHSSGFGIAEISARSRDMLMARCFAYVVESLSGFLWPQYADVLHRWMRPLHSGELLFVFWLLIIGAKPKTVEVPSLVNAAMNSNFHFAENRQ